MPHRTALNRRSQRARPSPGLYDALLAFSGLRCTPDALFGAVDQSLPHDIDVLLPEQVAHRLQQILAVIPKIRPNA